MTNPAKKFNSCNPGRSRATDRRNSRIEGRRFPRSIVKLRPSGGVGGKTRKKGFIRGPHRGRVGSAFVSLSSTLRSLSLSLSLFLSLRAGVWIPTGRCAHTMQRRHVCTRAHPLIRTKVEELSPLPRVPTCFRPQAAVITAQSQVVDQKDDAREERARQRWQRSASAAPEFVVLCRRGSLLL